MHNNYYFIRQLAKQLREKLTGWTLATAFSQEKDELVLGFSRETDEFYIKAILKPDFVGLAFPNTFHRARKNSVDLFAEIRGLSVTDVMPFRNDRSFALIFPKEYTLLFKMHGVRANVIGLQHEKPIDVFHHKFAADFQLDPETLHRDLEQTFTAFQQNDYRMAAVFPTFGKLVQRYLDEHDYARQSPERQWQLLEDVRKQLEQPTFYLTQLDGIPTLSLLPVGDVSQQTTDALEASNWLYYSFTHVASLATEKQAITRRLEKRKTQTQNYLTKTYEKLVALESASKNEHLANILMANLYQIPPRRESVELYDFYHDRPISIKLKPDLTPQKNAETYYRKAKNEKIEVEKLQESIARKEAELQRISQHLAFVAATDNLKELRAYVKTQQLSDETATAPTPDTLFKKYTYLDFDIWVGRNAKNNDLLTQKYAHKDDLWLHAKDVTGSHVIVKHQPGKNFPQPVVERAASLAAYFSKLRTDTLCPVIVTRKKFVRKPKGLPEGAVVVDREENVLLVEPMPMTENG